MAAAYLVLRTQAGKLVDLSVYSEPQPTSPIGRPMTNHLVVSATGTNYAHAKVRLDNWWHNRRPFQKRVLLHNSLLTHWAPIRI